MQTDTEVITYLICPPDPSPSAAIDVAADVLTAPEWDEIDRMDPERKEYFTNLRSIYNGALGERAVLCDPWLQQGAAGHQRPAEIALPDCGYQGQPAYFASEESRPRVTCPHPEKVWSVSGAEPVFIPLELAKEEDDD